MKTKVSIITLSAIVLNTLVVPGVMAQRRTNRFSGTVRGTATVDKQTLNKIAQGSAYEDSSGATDAVGEALENKTDDTQTPSTPDTEGSTGGEGSSETIEIIRTEAYKTAERQYNEKLNSAIAACSGLSKDLETIKGLVLGTAISSGVGGAAALGATTTSIIKAAKDKKVRETNELIQAKENQAAAGESLIDDYAALVKKLDDINSEQIDIIEKDNNTKQNIVSKLNSKYEQLEDLAKDASIDNMTIAKDYEKLKDNWNSIFYTITTETIDGKTKISKEKKSVDDLTPSDFSSANNILNDMILLGRSVNQDMYIDAKSSDTEKLEKQSKNLGYWTTGLMGTATVTSGISIATSFGATGNIDDLISDMEKCHNRMKDLEGISSIMSEEFNAVNEENDIRFEDHKPESVKRGENFATECAGIGDDISSIKDIGKKMKASGIISIVGTGTAGVGTLTAGLANRDDSKFNDIKNKKGLNVATSILAGVTTGTSLTSAILSSTQIEKLQTAIDNAKNCETALDKDNITVNITTVNRYEVKEEVSEQE